MTMTLFPVVLAGGFGTRLWPLSRKTFPKQFLHLQNEPSLLQQTIQRVQLLDCSRTIIVTNDNHYFLCQDELKGYAKTFTYLLEPCSRNTAPAIAATAHYLVQIAGPDAVMLVLPSDHWIPDSSVWRETVVSGIQFASKRREIVTFGITPDSPKSGYGYIELGESVGKNVYRAATFVEKPDLALATRMVEQSGYLWNSGMFVCRAGVYLDELKHYADDIYSASAAAVAGADCQHNYVKLETEAFAHCRNESIDYAVMEKTNKAVVIPVNMPWSDLGSWSSVAETSRLDEDGNALSGKVITQNTHNSLIISDDIDILVTTLGVHDQIIIVTSDAVLVADKQCAQEVKDLVGLLRVTNSEVIDNHRRVCRPWGSYEVLAEGVTFKVKRLMINPGAKLSLQMHQHRAEHWVVVSGEADVINQGRVMSLRANESTYIPQGAQHRLSNPGTEPLCVIEVQSGAYLGEDDIRRFDDIYDRRI